MVAFGNTIPVQEGDISGLEDRRPSGYVRPPSQGGTSGPRERRSERAGISSSLSVYVPRLNLLTGQGGIVLGPLNKRRTFINSKLVFRANFNSLGFLLRPER